MGTQVERLDTSSSHSVLSYAHFTSRGPALGVGHITKPLSGLRGVSQRALARQYPQHIQPFSQRETKNQGRASFFSCSPRAIQRAKWKERIQEAELELGEWGGRDVILITDERKDGHKGRMETKKKYG